MTTLIAIYVLSEIPVEPSIKENSAETLVPLNNDSAEHQFCPVLPTGAGCCRGRSQSGVARSAIRRTRPQGALLRVIFARQQNVRREEDGLPALAGAVTQGRDGGTARWRGRGNGAAAAARAGALPR
jgi:hypothetical protein